MLQAPRIVRWTLPALLLTLVVGGICIVAAGGREHEAESSSSPAATATTPERRAKARRVMVRRGDTATRIARRANLSVVELLKLNPNVDPRALRPGQKLKIEP